MIRFLPQQLYHNQSSSSDSSELSYISSNQPNIELPEESHSDDSHINSDPEEEIEHLGNSEINLPSTIDENDIFGWGDLLARVLSAQEEEEAFMRVWEDRFR